MSGAWHERSFEYPDSSRDSGRDTGRFGQRKSRDKNHDTVLGLKQENWPHGKNQDLLDVLIRLIPLLLWGVSNEEKQENL